MQDRITFLGTGGGRVVLSTQMRSTGGFVINLAGKQIHIDPGPGALLRCKECGIIPGKTDVLWASHNHTDHAHDINALADAITLGGVLNKGVLIATPLAINGSETELPCIQPVFKAALKEYLSLMPGDTAKIGELIFKATKADHDAQCNGLILKYGNFKIGYTSDTKYFPELADQYKDCDILICNVLRPGIAGWKTHLCTGDVAKIISVAKPRLCIITGFGAKMIKHNPIYEAREIQKETNINTIAAKDGLVVKFRDIV